MPTLLALAVLPAVVVYLAFRTWYGSIPPVPPTAAFTLFGLAVAELFLAPSVRARLEGRPRTKPILPLTVARTAALAKASSTLGALAAGCWVGVLAYAGFRLELPYARRDAVRAALGLAASLLLVVAALRLERVCRVPDPPPAEPGP